MSELRQEFSEGTLAAVSDANCLRAAGKKAWQPPHVIEGTIDETEAAAAGTADGGTHS